MKMKTALVTGASRGIGLAIAKAIAPSVDNLIIVAKHRETLAKAASQIKGIKLTTIVADLENEKETLRLVGEVKKKSDRLDILINNAGVYIGKRFVKSSLEEINKMINLNFTAYIVLTNQLLPLLKKGTNPQVINISSCAANAQIFGEAVYSATKAAITTFSNVLRKELNGENIRVTAVQPWGVDTYPIPKPEFLLNPNEIGELVSYIVNRPPTVQIDLVELSNIKQWRGNKPPWVE